MVLLPSPLLGFGAIVVEIGECSPVDRTFLSPLRLGKSGEDFKPLLGPFS